MWAKLKQHDDIIYQDNDFEVFIDPDGDSHNYLEIEVNALNTVFDLLLVKPYRNGGPMVLAWDLKSMQTAVELRGTLNDPKDKDKSLDHRDGDSHSGSYLPPFPKASSPSWNSVAHQFLTGAVGDKSGKWGLHQKAFSLPLTS